MRLTVCLPWVLVGAGIDKCDSIKSGRVTEQQLARLEGNITNAYMKAQELGDNTVTVKGKMCGRCRD